MIPAAQAPVCRIIAGPNGAGKTTFALTYLPQVAPGTAFVNADLIAAGLSPLAPEQQLFTASRLFLQQIETPHHRKPGLRVRNHAVGARVSAPRAAPPVGGLASAVSVSTPSSGATGEW